MNNDELKEINTDIIFLGIASILSILLFLVKINQRNRLLGYISIDKKMEANIIKIIRYAYLIVAIYFLKEAFDNLNECKNKANNNIIIDNAEKGLLVSFLIFLASLINTTTNNNNDDDEIVLY